MRNVVFDSQHSPSTVDVKTKEEQNKEEGKAEIEVKCVAKQKERK